MNLYIPDAADTTNELGNSKLPYSPPVLLAISVSSHTAGVGTQVSDASVTKMGS